MSKYLLEVPMQDFEDDFEFSYDYLIAEGDTLEECLENAVITIVDSEGQLVDAVPAVDEWMQDLVKAEFRRAVNREFVRRN